MDMETMQRLEREADERDQTVAVLEHWKRKADRRRSLAFWFSPWQVVDDPVAAVPASGDNAAPIQGCAPALGAGTRAAGSDVAPTNALTPLASGSVPGGPTHLYCSEASRISAANNRHT